MSLSYYKWGFVFLCPGKTRQFCFSEKKKLQENTCKWGFKRFQLSLVLRKWEHLLPCQEKNCQVFHINLAIFPESKKKKNLACENEA